MESWKQRHYAINFDKAAEISGKFMVEKDRVGKGNNSDLDSSNFTAKNLNKF